MLLLLNCIWTILIINFVQQQDSEEIDTNIREQNEAPANEVTNGEWAADFSEWGKDTEKEEPQGDSWANWGDTGANEQDQVQNLNREASQDSTNKMQEQEGGNESDGAGHGDR